MHIIDILNVADLLLVLLPFIMRMVIDSKLRDRTKKRMVYLIVILECLALLGLAVLSAVLALASVLIADVENTFSISTLYLIGMEILSCLLAIVFTNPIKSMIKEFF